MIRTSDMFGFEIGEEFSISKTPCQPGLIERRLPGFVIRVFRRLTQDSWA
jgi:hypothetical protein